MPGRTMHSSISGGQQKAQVSESCRNRFQISSLGGVPQGILQTVEPLLSQLTMAPLPLLEIIVMVSWT